MATALDSSGSCGEDPTEIRTRWTKEDRGGQGRTGERIVRNRRRKGRLDSCCKFGLKHTCGFGKLGSLRLLEYSTKQGLYLLRLLQYSTIQYSTVLYSITL